ncbi:PaaI family thioesterase, partial [Pseudomonas aeruginosa]
RRHYNPLGSVHGGYAASLLDSCMGCAIHTRLQAGQGYTTTDLRISYLRA